MVFYEPHVLLILKLENWIRWLEIVKLSTVKDLSKPKLF